MFISNVEYFMNRPALIPPGYLHPCLFADLDVSFS